MKTITILTLIFLWGSMITRGETLLVSTSTPDTSYNIAIVGAYQVGDEILITSDTESIMSVGMTIISYDHDSVEVDLPTIVARHIGDVDSIPTPPGTDIYPLYINREQVRSFDFSLGDGWVHTELFDWIFIRDYPWLFNPDNGWFFIVEAGTTIESGGLSSREAKLTYWKYSADGGWSFVSPYETSELVEPNPPE